MDQFPGFAATSLDGSSVSQFESMSSENRMNDSIDTRSFRREAKTMLLGSLSVDKTLLNVFKTKTSADASKGGLSDMSLASQSLAALSVGAGFYRESQFKSLSEDAKLRINCWNAFKAFSTEQGDLVMDGGTRGLPVGMLATAIRKVSKAIPPNELARRIQLQQFPSKAILSWREFEKFCLAVLLPPLGAAKNGDDFDDDNDYEQQKPAPSPFAEGLSKQTAYQRLLQKQRGASSIKMNHLPASASNDIGINASVTSLQNGHKVSTTTVNDAMLRVFKKEEATKRQEHMSLIASQAFSTQNDVDTAMLTKLVKPRSKLHDPLLKSKVYALSHEKETYGRKWEHMKAMRDERFTREIKKQARSDLISSFNRIVQKGEKEMLTKALSEQALLKEYQAIEKVNEKREANYATEERNRRWKEEQKIQRQRSAELFKEAISSSTLLSKSLLEEEKEEKRNTIKAEKFVLSEASSALITIPQELEKNITRARSYEAYLEAQRIKREYWEGTLDRRIKKYANAKRERMLRTTDMGTARVAITPMGPTSGGYLGFNESMSDTASKEEDDYLNVVAIREYLTRREQLEKLSSQRTLSREEYEAQQTQEFDGRRPFSENVACEDLQDLQEEESWRTSAEYHFPAIST